MRCLFFTSDQVYFVSTTTLLCEAVLQSSKADPGDFQQALGPGIMGVEAQPTFRLNRNSVPDLYRHLKEYTSRSPTFDSDALNAFKGIISAGRLYAYYGLSVSGTLFTDAAFGSALSWRSTRFSPRREATRHRFGFPAWSWTSLISQIEYLPEGPVSPRGRSSL
jgi:hypothetical protein